MRVVFWGTYDTGKPRVRILLRGLRENGVEVVECHKEVWGDVEDKSQIVGIKNKLTFLTRWIICYPILLWRYIRLPRHDAVIIGYMGHLDVLLLWPIARIRKVPVVWDAFISLYNTIVEDRCLVSRHHPFAWFLYIWEWMACRAADVVLLDTKAHAQYFVDRFNLSPERVNHVLVGVERHRFPPLTREDKRETSAITVLFYGQFIPLHGVETIIRAARLAKQEDVDWVLIGTGQEAEKIQTMLDEEPLSRIKWIPWVQYEELIDWIHRADICLGIFGDTSKAAMVIPNKVFQIISVGKPLITRDSPAIRELISYTNDENILLIPAGNPKNLVDAILKMKESKHKYIKNYSILYSITEKDIGLCMIATINELKK